MFERYGLTMHAVLPAVLALLVAPVRRPLNLPETDLDEWLARLAQQLE